MQYDVCVVGAGISGLATVRFLRERGYDAVCFETDDEVGGVIRSERVEGRVVEHGPQRVRLAGNVARLVEELDLSDETVLDEGTALYIYHDGELRRAPLSVRDAVKTDLLSWRGKARILLEPLHAPPRDDETVAEALIRSFGVEAYERLLGPLYAGLYSSKPDEMPARYSLARALDRFGRSVLVGVAKRLIRGTDVPPACSFDDGLQRLPEAMYAEHAADVHLGERVSDIERDDSDGFTVETGDRTLSCDDIVLTTPADETARLLGGVDDDTAGRLGVLSYNPLAVVHLVSEAGLDGTGHKFSLPAARDFVTTGVTWNAGAFGRDGVYTAYLGGAHRPDAVGWSDDRLGETAAREFEEVTGVPAEPLSVSRTRIPAYDTSWTEAGMEAFAPADGVHVCANYVDRAGIEGRISHARRVADEIDA